MKTLGIFLGGYVAGYWDEKTVANGIGGSETWAYEVSLEFSKRGYDVTLYAAPEIEHDINENFHMINYERYFYDLKEKSFDYFIYSRLGNMVSNELKCDNVYFMVHDVNILYDEETIGLDKIKKYCYLSDWHKDYLLELYSKRGLTEDKLYKVSNGYSKQYYDNVNLNTKINSMIWSSSFVRGFPEFYKYVFLPIKRQVPDFELYACAGTIGEEDKMMYERYSMLPYVKMSTKLPKEQLANIQKQSKIWVYNGVFPETFCITAVENAAAGNVIISPLSYGLKTTLSGIKYIKDFNLDILNKDNAQQFVDIAVKVLTDDKFRIKCAKESMKAANQYSWSNTVDELEKMFNE